MSVDLKPVHSSSLALGPSDVSNEDLLMAIDALIKRVTPHYVELIKNQAAQLKSSSVEEGITIKWSYRGLPTDSEGVAKNSLSVFPSPEGPQDAVESLEKTRCYVRLFFETKDLGQDDPLDVLLIHLHTRLVALGCEANGEFDVRFERGFMPSTVNNSWHFDETFKTSVTVCFSNRENWSTRIADLEKLGLSNVLSRAEMTGPQRISERNPYFPFILQKIEQCGEATQMGHFYDALKLYHRAPIPTDLGDKGVSQTDYRLFIRYRTFLKPNDERSEKKKIEIPKSEFRIDVDAFTKKDSIPKFERLDKIFDPIHFKVQDPLPASLDIAPLKFKLFESSDIKLSLTRVFNMELPSFHVDTKDFMIKQYEKKSDE